MKLNIVKEQMINYNADAFLFISEINRFWITNFQSSFGFAIVEKNKIYLYLDGRYFEKAKSEIKDQSIELILYKSFNQVIQDMQNRNIKTVLVEAENFLFIDYEKLKSSFSKIISCQTQPMRIVKSEEEIKSLKKAAGIACQAMEWIQKEIKIGMTEKEVAALVTYKMMQLGASGNSFDPIVASGVNGAYPHHKPTDKKIQNNEFVTIDMGCIYKGYCSDITRTFPIGKPKQELIDAYKVVYKSNTEGIKATKNNIIGAELDLVCRKIINETKFKDFFPHSTGHGVGIEVHELPNVSPLYQGPIVPNSIVTIEPGIYLPKIGGIRIEDMVLATSDKPIVLTKSATKWKP